MRTRPRGLFSKAVGSNWLALAGGIVLVTIVLASLLAPVLAPFDPYEIRPELRLSPPGTGPYVLGGDDLGRDVLSRLLWGSRSSLAMGLLPVIIASALGSMLGIVAGYMGGALDRVVMRAMDAALAFPSILLALGIAASIGPGLANVVLSLTIVETPKFARLIRAATLTVRNQEYVLAAKAVGAGAGHIMLKHILRNVLSPIIVVFSLEAGRMVIMSAGLSFLGLGPRPPAADWGAMLSSGQRFLSTAPHLATIPGVALVVVTVCLNLVGDRIRDVLDPRFRS